jgi:hypothetical protein
VRWVLLAVPLPWAVDRVFEPSARMPARNQSIFLNIVPGTAAVASLEGQGRRDWLLMSCADRITRGDTAKATGRF